MGPWVATPVRKELNQAPSMVNLRNVGCVKVKDTLGVVVNDCDLRSVDRKNLDNTGTLLERWA